MTAYVTTPTVEQARKIIRLIAERNGRAPRPKREQRVVVQRPKRSPAGMDRVYTERKIAKSKNVGRLHLAYAASQGSRISLPRCLDALGVMLNLIVESVANGDEVQIRGAMTFYGKIRKPRPARNIRTGEVVPLLERRVMLCRFLGRKIS